MRSSSKVVLLQEAVAEATRLAETATFAEATTTTSGSRRFRARLIEGNRWGSSGYYSREMLERDGPSAFAAGTQVFIDHPGEAERYDRPERSIRDLAGTIASTPVYESDGLYADVEVFAHVAPVIEAMRDDIGMSIRANGTSEQGEAAGRTGAIITSLTEGLSVDFVTRAGAGGRIVALLESARPERVSSRAVRRGVAEATVNETREQLQQVLRETYGGDESWVWVRDFDATQVWFEHETPDESGVWQQAYTTTDRNLALSGQRIEVRAETRYVPVAPAAGSTTATEAVTEPPVIPAGQSTTTESRRGTTMEIEETEFRRLETEAGRVPTLESERDQARAERDRLTAREAARPIVTAVVAESTTLVGARTQARVVETVLADVPTTDDGTLDEAALRTAAETARTAAEAEVAEYATTTPVGRVRTLGEATVTPEDNEIRERSAAAQARAFGRRPEQKGA